MTYTFTIPFAAHGKGAPRMGVVNGHAVAFKDAGTRSWMATVATLAATVLPVTPIDGPVSVRILAYLPRPDRLLKRSKRTGELLGGAEEGVMPAPCKPDADNIAKGILDALSSHWRDDRQVVILHVEKWYTEANRAPRTVVTVETYW